MNKELKKSLLREYARRYMPMAQDVDLWPSIYGHVLETQSSRIAASQSSQVLGRGRGSGFHLRGLWVDKKLVMAGSLASILMALGLISVFAIATFTQPSAVSADELLLRADQASLHTTSASSINGVHSTHAVVTQRFRNDPAGEFSESLLERWIDVPDKIRTVNTIRTPDGKEFHLAFGSTGSISYRYSEDGKDFSASCKKPVTLLDKSLDTSTQRASGLGPFADVYDAEIVGTESVGGHSMAYVLDLKLKDTNSGTSSNLEVVQHRKKVWIHQKVYLPVREQAWNKDGVLVYEYEYQSLEVNPNLDPSIFQINPPAGYKLPDCSSDQPAK